MPTYEYRCPNGHTFEKFYPQVNDRRRLRCPTCGKTAERIISGGGGIVFKGSGFYATDYKRSKIEGDAGTGDSGKKEGTGGDAKSQGESKPAKKTDSSDK
ncbi:MAG TPA: zinc ribbon domain-containing protein [Gemmatimonadales bacterium]|nr:zinc ribbon domain-containing protein [Gemmatimonadales bacterium]